MEKRQGSDILKEMSEIRLTGNIIPTNWFLCIGKTIKNGNFKANLLAINILSDIVYWYRLTDIRDESTGFTIEKKKKFKADKLQMSYDQMAVKFGSSKIACKRASDLLSQLGAIVKDMRHIQLPNGTKLFNVLYVEPVPEWVKINSQCLLKSKEVLTIKSDGLYKKVNTNTKTSTKTSTDIIEGKPSQPSLTRQISDIFSKGYESLEGTKLIWEGAKFGKTIKSIVDKAKESTDSENEKDILEEITARSRVLFSEIQKGRKSNNTYWSSVIFTPMTLMSRWNNVPRGDRYFKQKSTAHEHVPDQTGDLTPDELAAWRRMQA